MFAVAGDGAGVADSGSGVRLIGIGGRWITGHASEDALAKGAQRLRAGIEGLNFLISDHGVPRRCRLLTYGRTSRASASSFSWFSMYLQETVSQHHLIPSKLVRLSR